MQDITWSCQNASILGIIRGAKSPSASVYETYLFYPTSTLGIFQQRTGSNKNNVPAVQFSLGLGYDLSVECPVMTAQPQVTPFQSWLHKSVTNL